MATSIDLSVVVQFVFALLGTVLTVFGSRVLLAVESKFHIQVSAAQNSQYDTALNKALTFAITQSQELIAAKGWDHLTTKNAILSAALPYLLKNFGQTLAAVGLSGKAGMDGDTLKNALQRALPAAALAASSSPSTPPAPLLVPAVVMAGAAGASATVL